MPQFTNEQIAEAATRLYNRHPTGVAPETAVVTPSLPERPTPSGPATASHAAPESSRVIPPLPERPTAPGPATSTPPHAAAAAANWPTGETVALEAIYAAGRRMIESAIPSQPFSAWPTSMLSPSPSTAPSPDRLQSFLQSIRSVPAGETPTLGAMSQHLRSGPQLHRGAKIDPSSRPFDVAAVRRDFPILNQQVHGRPLAWLDNAATTQKPQCVIDALSQFYAHDNSNIHRAAHTLAARATDAYEGAREKVRAFLGAGRPEEIVFVRGTTEGINLVTQTYGRKFLQPGDEIILSVLEHHANIVPWQMVAKERGAQLRVIPVNDRGEIIMEEYQRLLGPRTRVVALTQASNSLGTILPVAEMTQAAKRYGARVLIDGAQSVAHLPVNVRQLDCDFFVFSGHKIFGPTGIGAVYAKQELLEIIPPWQGGGSMIKDVTFEETTYSAPPAKFEAGTPNIADAAGLGAALDYVNRLGLPNIARYEHELLEYGTAQLARIDGLRLVGTAREKVGVLSFVLPGRDTVEVGKRLDLEGIAVRAGHHCAQPSLRRFGLESTVRPSLSIYNTRDEIDRLAEAVRRILHR